MEYNLFLDDYRIPINCVGYMWQHIKSTSMYSHSEWVIVKNYDEFVKHITENGLPVLVSFDHDLAPEHYCPQEFWDSYTEWRSRQNFKEKTGLECAEWLVNHCKENGLKLPDYLSHSMNPTGQAHIQNLLDKHKE